MFFNSPEIEISHNIEMIRALIRRAIITAVIEVLRFWATRRASASGVDFTWMLIDKMKGFNYIYNLLR